MHLLKIHICPQCPRKVAVIFLTTNMQKIIMKKLLTLIFTNTEKLFRNNNNYNNINLNA